MRTDVLPKFICTVCLEKVTEFHAFYRDVHAGQQNFIQNWVKSENPSSNDDIACSSAINVIDEADETISVLDILVKPEPDDRFYDAQSIDDESFCGETFDNNSDDDAMDYEENVDDEPTVKVENIDSDEPNSGLSVKFCHVFNEF